MEVGDVAAWFAVAVALIAAFIALGNANSAKRQAKAAESGVQEAKRSAAASEAQAEAARAQVTLMREQLALGQAERLEQDRLDQREALVAVINTARPWISAAETAALTFSILPTDEAVRMDGVQNHGPASIAFDQALVQASVAVTDTELARLVAEMIRIKGLMTERFDPFHSCSRDANGKAPLDLVYKAYAVPRAVAGVLEQLEQLAVQRFAAKPPAQGATPSNSKAGQPTPVPTEGWS
ncbi:hypothetical protein KCV87_14615 [Actinosynnema pretiosum subsp. pretiosum]|uniref:Uncharacterized protein n=1 Tax=Actinosynnema pretiosum subsp. pretiosum TaxID=103721 RepID=A0AA45R6Y0_9PSEU|nr:hypothetical protein KCV87_14615 [Actinosynnema pretiosum subsp. pretiosum]